MTDQSSPPALAHGEALMVPAPEGVDAAISRVMARHQDELDAALEPFDVSLDDLVQATWMRFVRVGDVEALRSAVTAPPSEAEVARTVLPLLDGLDDGEACDPTACAGGCSREGRAPMYGGRDEDGI